MIHAVQASHAKLEKVSEATRIAIQTRKAVGAVVEEATKLQGSQYVLEAKLKGCQDRIAYLESAGAAIQSAFAACYSELEEEGSEDRSEDPSMSPFRDSAAREGWGAAKVRSAREEVAAMSKEKEVVDQALVEKTREGAAWEARAEATETSASQCLSQWQQDWKAIYMLEMGEPSAMFAHQPQPHGDAASNSVAEVALRRVREACQQIVVLEAENKALKVQVA